MLAVSARSVPKGAPIEVSALQEVWAKKWRVVVAVVEWIRRKTKRMERGRAGTRGGVSMVSLGWAIVGLVLFWRCSMTR